jgi:predicted 2-oxoglutarate/Fe(II)-dependent dioxygenase YbiX
MPNLAQALADTLAAVQRPGGFHAAGSFDIHPPRLEVEGVGTIALPLLPVQADALIEVAEQAPYGRGTETLVDTAVRRTWQIDAARVRITGQRWREDLDTVVERVRSGLAVAGAIEAQLYKLLIYDAGSFFVPHRDTEKAPGMFATLVVVLPGDYSGGELVIRHRGEEVRVDLHRDEPSEAAFAAFYADCLHEVLPIASGHRLALIYNLVRRGPGPLPQAPDYGGEQTRLTRLLGNWAGSESGPDKLIYPLEHAYTEAEVAFGALKGKDAAVAQVMIPAATDAGCDLHLALISVSESGWAEYTGGGRWNDPELEIGEVTESDWSIHDWRLPDGGRPEMGPLPFAEDELAPPDALADLDQAEAEFSEATGNEGASFERRYQRAALILWPRQRRAAVLAAGGLAVSVPALLALVQRWEAAGAKAGDDLWHQARALARVIRDGWPQDAWARRQASESKRTRDLFAVQLRLGDLEGCVGFIAGHSTAGAYGAADNPALAAVLGQLSSERAAALLTAVIAGNVRLPGACAGLLARCAQQADPGRLADLRAPALALLEGLPDGREAPPLPNWERPEPLTPAQIADAVTGFARIDGAIADRAVERFLALPALYDLDRLLLPAALILCENALEPEPPAVARLRQAVLAHLEARIALRLDPPSDWARASEVPCGCAHCRGLSRFLASPSEPVWHFKAAESDRSHVAHMVNRANCDLDLTTDKRGRPYTLVCAKNQASFERRVAQRAQDLGHRERLIGRSLAGRSPAPLRETRG